MVMTDDGSNDDDVIDNLLRGTFRTVAAALILGVATRRRSREHEYTCDVQAQLGRWWHRILRMEGHLVGEKQKKGCQIAVQVADRGLARA